MHMVMWRMGRVEYKLVDAKDQKAKTMEPWPTTTTTWPKNHDAMVNNHNAVAKDHNTSAKELTTLALLYFIVYKDPHA